MSHEHSLDISPAVSPDPAGNPLSALQMIVDPAAALQAARRMEASCRSGLRFFSDFRRVRPLDSFDPDALELDAELVDDGYPALESSPFDSLFEPRFDPRFSRGR
ncbi:MAG: hypothetical protein ACKODB_04675 [Betaproteobacteria bacterium]